jgi:polysaccharide biosynthesis protein PelA
MSFFLRGLGAFLALTLYVYAARATVASGYEPRVVIGIYDAEPGATFEASYLYEMAEFPLNHIGLELEYHNARQGLPDLSKRTDVRGVLIWLIDADKVAGGKLAAFVESASARGTPVLVTGPLPSKSGDAAANRIFAALGLRNLGGFRPYTYDMAPVHKVASMVEFERKLPVPLVPTDIVQAVDPKTATPYLTLQRGADPSTRTLAVVTTPNGGYVAPGYASYEDRTADWKAWRVDPFALFREVFKTESLPIADTATLSGRRIYYSHIDGDGWNSVTEVDAYAKAGLTASEVILREVALRFPDLPITVAPIAADLDPDWMGTPKAQEIARAFFRLPHIEAGTHTYTHPFEWGYFGPGYNPQSELHFVKRYSKSKVAPSLKIDPNAPKPRLVFPYDVPRAYGDIPFSVDKEVSGSVAFISRFLPPGKKVEVLQWSGDTRAFPAAMDALSKAGLPNINGWGSRFDGDYPSYTNVAPVGRRIGDHVRVYASHANENEYTALWQGRYFGFRYLITSLRNTETPRRVKPANIYYHMYSGEKPAAMTALLEIMAHVRTQTLTPITTSRYAQIGKGFFDIRFARIGDLSWRIENRSALDTIRFDAAQALHVDYARSKGVLGHTRTNGSLYVAIDSDDASPVLTLGRGPEPAATSVLLNDSRWRVYAAARSGKSLAFSAEGFGDGEMRWRAPPGRYRLTWRTAKGVDGEQTATAGPGGLVSFRIPTVGMNRVRAKIEPLMESATAQ